MKLRDVFILCGSATAGQEAAAGGRRKPEPMRQQQQQSPQRVVVVSSSSVVVVVLVGRLLYDSHPTPFMTWFAVAPGDELGQSQVCEGGCRPCGVRQRRAGKNGSAAGMRVVHRAWRKFPVRCAVLPGDWSIGYRIEQSGGRAVGHAMYDEVHSGKVS